jgi:hypothetical protein
MGQSCSLRTLLYARHAPAVALVDNVETGKSSEARMAMSRGAPILEFVVDTAGEQDIRGAA